MTRTAPPGPKDVFSLSEVDELHSLIGQTNEFLLNAADYDDIRVTGVIVNLEDQFGRHVGSFTSYTKDEDVKFEPNFKAEIFGE